MRFSVRAALAVILAAVALGPAIAQPPADDATLVEGLIVRPRLPGPAWWSVSDDDSRIYVMVVPEYTPRGLAWDKATLERRMEGANRLILPAEANLANPLVLGRALLIAPRLGSNQPLEPQLSAEGRERFVALREQVGKPASEYANLRPFLAASSIRDDYFDHIGLVRGEALAVVEASARRHRVRTLRAATLPAGRALDALRLEDMPGVECLEATVGTVRARAEALSGVALAWAEGDVRPLVQTPAVARGPRACANPGVREDRAVRIALDFVGEHVATFERVLGMKGHSVAVVDEGLAFTRNGILERLRARSYTIDTPITLDD